MINVARKRNHAYAVQYAFSQGLSAPASLAYDWCTDYQPYDFAIMKEKGSRKIERITENTILLTESTRRRNHVIKKVKLVRLNKPSFSWTNTHIGGPNRHSQFLYRIVPEGKARSRLYFQGLLIQYSRKRLGSKELMRIATEERRADAKVWRNLAEALRRESGHR